MLVCTESNSLLYETYFVHTEHTKFVFRKKFKHYSGKELTVFKTNFKNRAAWELGAVWFSHFTD